MQHPPGRKTSPTSLIRPADLATTNVANFVAAGREDCPLEVGLVDFVGEHSVIQQNLAAFSCDTTMKGIRVPLSQGICLERAS
jgi:hypothetical protein